MSHPKTYQTFADFERDVLRGSTRIGQSLEEMVEDTSFDAEIEVDRDPFEEMKAADDY